MSFKRKIIYFLSMSTLPLFGCQKEPMSPENNDNNNPDTTEIVSPNQPDLPAGPAVNMDSIFANADTLWFSWFYDWVGPLDDYVKSFTDVGDRVVIVPETTEQSIKGSCERVAGQWPDIYNRFMNFVAESAGHVKLSGCIYVQQIADNLSNNVMGMDRNNADLFKELGIEVKVKNVSGKSTQNPVMTPKIIPQNTMPNMLQSETGYTIEFEFWRHLAGPSDDNIARRAAQYGSTHVVPDSTFWSQVQQQQFSKEHWDLLAAKFMKFQKEYGTTFTGTLYPRLGWMSPEAKTTFENLGFHVIEMVKEYNHDGSAMPWNQASKMVRNR